ncbi:hypothetical protein [Paenarthrobacter sp. YJN-5]|uniref:hypothetical protein n=1 Tax=unclassified Paenarthrobacter TaxID=2634190 RepID=UPI0018783EBE|nr:hypothetical protein [Paenarthrobacter sp. YJN-5]QOT19455.1 hypothetical protein HMI59_22705 [Paenarthrobacter sp. YJN-5]
MASTTSEGTPAHDPVFEQALLSVELELMRTPSLAKLNGARRREISRGILASLSALGVLTGISALENQPQLRAA